MEGRPERLNTGRKRPRVEGRRGGKPTKLTEELADKIVALIRAGNYAEVAAAANGVPKSTFFEWLRNGAARPGSIFGRLNAAVHEAAAAAEVADLVAIGKMGHAGAWQALAWRLERKFPERYGRRERVELSGSVEQRQTGAVAMAIATDPQASELAHALLARVAAAQPAEDETDGSGDS